MNDLSAFSVEGFRLTFTTNTCDIHRVAPILEHEKFNKLLNKLLKKYLAGLFEDQADQIMPLWGIDAAWTNNWSLDEDELESDSERYTDVRWGGDFVKAVKAFLAPGLYGVFSSALKNTLPLTLYPPSPIALTT